MEVSEPKKALQPSSNVPPLDNEQTQNSFKEDGTNKSGLFVIKTANDWEIEAAQRPDPKPLWLTVWYECEACCLFADSNVGKTILAYQIGTIISELQPVLYFDFELSDKQFQLRYTDKDNGQLFKFPPNLYRIEINIEGIDFDTDFEDSIIKNMEKASLEMNAKVLIVDNLTWLCNASEKGDEAGRLMKALMGLKRKHGLSILVLAHTPKRSLSNPITQNDLAGSKKLFNFFDSVFAIGFSAKDDGQRYIKQLKCRSGEFRYSADNVIVCCIEKVGAFLKFTQIGYATEKEHLKSMDKKEEIALIENIVVLQSEGKTQREIATELGISLSKVNRLIKKHQNETEKRFREESKHDSE